MEKSDSDQQEPEQPHEAQPNEEELHEEELHEDELEEVQPEEDEQQAEVTLEAELPPPPEPPAEMSGDGAAVEPSWDGPTRVGDSGEIADLAAQSAVIESAARLESIVESLLFASDRPLGVSDLKRLVAERDAKKIAAVIEALRSRYAEGGIQLASVAGGWQFRTNPANSPWVSKLMAGRPQRLSRALLETLAIVAYRQPITRPEIDEIRGVDCGPVLKTLLERGLVRMIGKKEDVGRPILYGTTAEFLRTFSLKDLTELPTLRDFHELSEAEMAEVDARTERTVAGAEGSGSATAAAAPPPAAMPAPAELTPDDTEADDSLLSELERATAAAAQAATTPADASEQPPPAEPHES
jgi:segregation and condensation protein B